MKATMKVFPWMAMLLLAITGCTNDNEGFVLLDKQPVEFVMSVDGNTRTVTDNDNRQASWVEGDAIGIFVFKKGMTDLPEYANMKYVLGSDGKWYPADANNSIYADADYDYYAYYPYVEDALTPSYIGMSIKDNQSTEDGSGLAASDILASRTSANARINVIELTYDHLLSMVEVTVEGGDIVKPEAVVLNGIKTDCAIDLISQDKPFVKIAGKSESNDINMYYVRNDATADLDRFVYRAIVPSQMVEAGSELLTVSNPIGDGAELTMSHNADVLYKVGKCRKITMVIEKKVELIVDPNDFAINLWELDDPMAGDVEEIEKPAIQVTVNEKAPYEEKFLASEGDFVIPVVSKWVWNNGQMEVNGESMGAESWLLSPYISIEAKSFESTSKLTFLHAVKTPFTEGKLTLNIREKGTDTWEEIAIPSYPVSQTFISSGDIDLTPYIGKNVQFGFKYAGSAAETSYWGIKDFMIQVIAPEKPSVVIFKESFGSPQKEADAWPKVKVYTGWDNGKDLKFEDSNNCNEIYAWDTDLSNGKLHLAGSIKMIKITGINTEGYTNLKVRFKLAVDEVASGENPSCVNVQFKGGNSYLQTVRPDNVPFTEAHAEREIVLPVGKDGVDNILLYLFNPKVGYSIDDFTLLGSPVE